MYGLGRAGGGGHDSAHNGHESTDIVTFRDVSGKCRQPAGSSALLPETLGGGRAGAWPQPPVFTQALLPWAWPAAQEGLPEERGTWGGCADAGRAPPGRAHTATARPGAWPRSWDAEPVGGAARAARGAPRSRGVGCRVLQAAQHVSVHVCRVRCAVCVHAGAGAHRGVHTHTRAHVCTCMCAVLAFAQAASVTPLPDPKVRGNLGLLNQLTRHLHFSVFCAIRVANRKTNINCDAQ